MTHLAADRPNWSCALADASPFTLGWHTLSPPARTVPNLDIAPDLAVDAEEWTAAVSKFSNVAPSEATGSRPLLGGGPPSPEPQLVGEAAATKDHVQELAPPSAGPSPPPSPPPAPPMISESTMAALNAPPGREGSTSPSSVSSGGSQSTTQRTFSSAAGALGDAPITEGAALPTGKDLPQSKDSIVVTPTQVVQATPSMELVEMRGRVAELRERIKEAAAAEDFETAAALKRDLLAMEDQVAHLTIEAPAINLVELQVQITNLKERIGEAVAVEDFETAAALKRVSNAH